MPFKYRDPDTGETKEFTYDVGSTPDDESKVAEQPPITPDLGEDTTGWDINKKTKRTLGQYLSRITHGQEGSSKRGNEFAVDDTQVTLETTDSNGYPTSPNIQHTGDHQGSEGYHKNVRDIPELGYKSTSDDYSDAVQKNNFAIHKGTFKSGAADSATSQNGNTLLKTIDTLDGEKLRPDPEKSFVVDKYVSQVLKHNRFSSTNLRVGDAKEVSVKMNTEIGKNNLEDDAHTYTQQRLANVGLLLSLRASGEWSSTKDNVNPAGGQLELKAMLPSTNQFGIERVSVSDFNVTEIVNNLTTSEDVTEIDPAGKSWGALNNVHDQYFGAGAMGMQILALSLLVSVLVLMEVFGLIFSFLTSSEFIKRDPHGRPLLGAYMTTKNGGDPNGFPPSLGPALLGLMPTKNDLRKAVEEGMKAFYGLDEISVSSLTKKAASAALSALVPSADSPGMQIAVSRTILRSSLSVVDAVKGIGGNPVAIIKGILGLLDVIKRSKFITAINLFASLGDQIITNNNSPLMLDKAIEEAASRKSAIDSLDPEVSNAAQMNRLFQTNIIAWGAHRAPFQMLMPSALVMPSAVATNLGAQQGTAIIPMHSGKLPYSQKKMQVIGTNNGRIDTEEREKFEKQLDSEYVPFYFHDLRTNEIIAFHAFLQSLNDSYNVAWENVEGIGRIDPVKIYKNTTRKLDLMFFVAATNRADFDIMWLKINKLLTMIYPQFTKGRTIFDGNTLDSSSNVIVQPFSQVMSASPLIRMRIGDVIRSNYSKFNLARLFGFGMPEMKIDGKSMKLVENDLAKKNDKFIREIKHIWDGTGSVPDSTYQFEIDDGEVCHFADSGDYAKTWTVGGSDPGVMPKAQFLSCTIKEFKDGWAVVEIGLKGSDELQSSQLDEMNSLKRFWTDSEWSATRVIGAKYYVSPKSLRFTPKSFVAVDKNLSFGVSTDIGDSLNTFMSEDKNALVKSFKETGGKGLAGVIESMNFHWLENIPWEIDPGRTAPMICKINLNFAPIHDIAPGLDWQGYNRAPVYPVGEAYAQKVKTK